jgi:hypothetical protein
MPLRIHFGEGEPYSRAVSRAPSRRPLKHHACARACGVCVCAWCVVCRGRGG